MEMEDYGAVLADTFGGKPSNSPRVKYGTVTKVSGSTLDVSLAGGTITGVCMTVSCAGAEVGDRVVLLVDGALVTCLGIVATADNARYVELEEFSQVAQSHVTKAEFEPIAKRNERVELYRGRGLTSGKLKDLGDFKAIDVYMTADIDGTSNTFICIHCVRDGRGWSLRGLSGTGFGGGEMRFVGCNISNPSGDDMEVWTTAYRIKNGNVIAMDDRPIRVVVGVERF